MKVAANNGHFEVVKWLYVNHPESRTPDAIAKALLSGHVRFALWLSKKFPAIALSYKDVSRSEVFRVDAGYADNLFEVLLFLRVVYPGVFTPGFLQELRKKFSGSCHVDTHNSSFALAWLDEYFSSSLRAIRRS